MKYSRFLSGLVVVGLALGVASCNLATTSAALGTLAAGTTKNPVTPKLAYELEASYVLVREIPRQYRRLPFCSTTIKAPCQAVAAAIQIKRADKAALDALAALHAFALAHDSINLPAAYDAATAAIATFKSIASLYAKQA